MKNYDVIIVGAGAIGAFIARNLSKYQLDVLLIEKENDVGNVTSMANSAIVHSGYDPLPGTNKAKFNVLGNKMFKKICEELDVKFIQNGSLTLAFDKEQYDTLISLKERAKENGVEVKILNKDETLKLEPNISDDVFGSLLAPTAGIVDPFNLVAHAAENAVDNGVTLHLNEEVLSVDKIDDFIVKTSLDSYKAKVVINAAGLNSDKLSKIDDEHKFNITPRKGEYFILNHFDDNFVKHTLFPLPSKKGKGILFSPTTSNNYIMGPSSEAVPSVDDFSTDTLTLNAVKESANRMVKNIPNKEIIRVFSGLRATPDTHDFMIFDDKDRPGYIVVGGIESPGLVSSPAIGEYVVSTLVKKHLPLKEKNNYNPRVKKYIHLKELNDIEKKELISKHKEYGQIICNCEAISLGEILDNLNRSVPPRTIKAIKKRTRAGFGKCQGGFCQSKVLFILVSYYHLDPKEILYDKNGSFILDKKAK